jgi:hypothetical protein
MFQQAKISISTKNIKRGERVSLSNPPFTTEFFPRHSIEKDLRGTRKKDLLDPRDENVL